MQLGRRPGPEHVRVGSVASPGDLPVVHRAEPGQLVVIQVGRPTHVADDVREPGRECVELVEVLRRVAARVTDLLGQVGEGTGREG
ncbi:hypothetical protein BJ986_002587 [Phycicoccus badiiscoriae]|uniref:Uncharacterized protein n=1 Tax=Pedococcus badiiscoriae TaxID=642776 RepID=A0A852WGY4_9MICO|nr:hypothetical protein [Pedococcus badiiscoriae]